MKVTPEQADCARCYVSGDSLKIRALAGTGKTTTLRYLVHKPPPRGGRVLYTSFGAKIVAEAKAKFPAERVKVSTNHGLAFASHGKAFANAGRLASRIQASALIDRFGIRDSTFAPHADARTAAYGVIETVNRFCQSKDLEITMRHTPVYLDGNGPSKADNYSFANLLVGQARLLWSEMVKPGSSLPVTHDVYLKLWALDGVRLPYTTILLDEAQDTSELMIDVLARQDHAQLVICGDENQAIYAWRGAVSAMDAFDTVNTATLSRSFRFGPSVAAVANAVLERHCRTNARLSGDPSIASIVGHVESPRCVVARTNSALVAQLVQAVQEAPGARHGVVGGVDDLIRLAQGSESLMRGARTTVPDLAEFSSWTEVREASEKPSHRHLTKLVKLMDEYGPTFLIRTMESVRGHEQDEGTCRRIFSTTHKAKGREFDSVVLEDDFHAPPIEDKKAMAQWNPEESNLLYVAATRARRGLDPTSCAALLDAWRYQAWPSA